MAGLIKVALMLEAEYYVPSIHNTQINEKIDSTNLVVQTKTEPFERLPGGKSIMCAVNSFGFGGANAMTVLKQVDSMKVEDNLGAEKAGWHLAGVNAGIEARVC